MDHDSAEGAPDARLNQQVDNAIRAIQQKKPRPEIDFTIHVMEDGTEVSTQERVCKGTVGGVVERSGRENAHDECASG